MLSRRRRPHIQLRTAKFETCSMQVAVCIESICTIQTLSAHTVHSWVGFCIPHLHCAFRTTLFLASPTYIGRVFAFCTCILHRTLFALSSLLAVGEFLHSALCILHPARLSQLYLWARFCILHPASASCIGGSSLFFITV